MKPKHYLLALAICLSGSQLSAQPTLTSANGFAAGLSITAYRNTTYTTPGPAGANQTWDFSNQNFGGSTTYQFTNCTGVNPPCSNYSTSNVVLNDNGFSAYYTVNSSSQTFFGTSNMGSTIVYSNGQDYLRFPMNYNTKFTDNFKGLVNNGVNPPFPRQGVDSVFYDAYGTVKTPGGTYNNAMRIKMVERYVDTLMVSPVMFLYEYRQETYLWYIPNARYPIYSTTAFSVGVTGGTPNTTYSSSYWVPTLGIEDLHTQALTCTISPNPAYEQITLQLGNGISDPIACQLYDPSGKVVQSWQKMQSHSGKFVLPLNPLSSGVYFLEVTSEAGKVVKKVILEEQGGYYSTPFTSAIIVFEMTDRHSIIFFLFIGAILANTIAVYVDRIPFYYRMSETFANEAE